MNIEDLTPEQLEKAKACTSPEELLALAKDAGYELTDDELDAVVGGRLFGLADSAGDVKEPGCLWYSCTDRSDGPMNL